MKNTGLPTHRRYGAERRDAPRREVSMDARLVHDDGVLEGEVENVASGGASFSTRTTEPELAADTHVVLRATIATPDGDRRIERRGRVTRCEDFFDGEEDVMTYAISFDEPLVETVVGDEES